jgi:hypothetical protein
LAIIVIWMRPTFLAPPVILELEKGNAMMTEPNGETNDP